MKKSILFVVTSLLITTFALIKKKANATLKYGPIVFWKACISPKISESGEKSPVYVYVKLLVPPEAKRVTPNMTSEGLINPIKSRVEYAKVLEITDREGNKYESAWSFVSGRWYEKPFEYRIGEIVEPDSYNDDSTVSCGAGINVYAEKSSCEVWFDKEKLPDYQFRFKWYST